ncbi:ABC transporter family substrate-binding protein [Streptomyces sp. RKAG293]|uniref:ABC transporter family substrate-binding protein n=1 Tax=Streptomyces sp. RKAG293 TaxID=2893403 RepID=UPI0020341123|nr:ABC transporter family substrate-binding protein [Streptomyces sp. RKAG293]MCM2416581.1 ABC transporter family substrate-binding protein [Streptomyces sp. RKAG293]
MSRHTLKLATAIALSAGIALSASACSGSTKTGSAGATHGSYAATANMVNPVNSADLKQGGTLNFPVDQYSTQWNVYNADSQNEVSIVDTMAPMLPSLYHSTADNKLSTNTDYLLNVKNGIVGGKQVTTYELNPRGKWSDGSQITWKDFQAIWASSNGKDPKYSVISTTGFSQISSVAQGKDQFEVIVTYSSPFADWQSLFSPLYPASQIGTLDGFKASYKNKIPVTAGPFKVQSMNPTTKVVTEVRDPNWWGTKPVLNQINFRTMDAATAPSAFASGEVDISDIGPSVDAYKKAKSVPGVSIRVAGAPNLRQLLLNGDSPNLKDQSVRQAVFQGINRAAIGQSDLNGLPWPIKSLNNHFLVNNANGYVDNAGALGAYDPKGAGAKLDAAGWKAGANGYRSKNGKELDLSLEIPAGTPVATNESQLLVPMLKAIGIKVTVVNGAADQFFNDIAAGKFDLTIFSGVGGVPFFPLTNSEASFLAPVKGNVGQNYSRLGSTELDATMNTAGTDIDAATYLADINKSDQLLWQLAVNLPLYQRPQIVATKPTLANYGAFGFQDTDWTKIGFTK